MLWAVWQPVRGEIIDFFNSAIVKLSRMFRHGYTVVIPLCTKAPSLLLSLFVVDVRE